MTVGPEIVHLSVDASIATVTLDSPANRNALSRRLVEQLRRAIDDAASDNSVRAVVLTGTGTVFCSGADLTEAASGAGAGGPGFATLLEVVWDLPKIVVVKLNGHVRAGGLGLVAAADIVISPERATLAFTEVRIGVAPAMIAVLCTRRMSSRAAGRYLLTGEPMSAAEAVDAGLVTIVVDDDALDVRTAAVLDEIRTTEPNAVRETKRLLRTLGQLDVPSGLRHAEEVSRRLFASPEAAEGMAAFREKRPPSWQA